MFVRVGRGCRISSFGTKAFGSQRILDDSRQSAAITSSRTSRGSAGVRLLRLRETTTWRLGRPRHEAPTLTSIRSPRVVLQKGGMLRVPGLTSC